MIRTYKADGIILKRRNLGESDRLITVFTKQYGKKALIAKGIRRITSRRAPHLELFSHVVLLLHLGKTFDTITEVTTQTNFSFIRKKLERVGFAYIALELTDKLTAENQESSVIFSSLLNFLTQLNTNGLTRSEAQVNLAEFTRIILSDLGFISKDMVGSQQSLDALIESILESRLKARELLTSIQVHV